MCIRVGRPGPAKPAREGGAGAQQQEDDWGEGSHCLGTPRARARPLRAGTRVQIRPTDRLSRM